MSEPTVIPVWLDVIYQRLSSKLTKEVNASQYSQWLPRLTMV